MEVIVEKENLAQKAGEKVSELLRKYQSRPILLMLSGGSAFSLLEYVDTSLLGEHVAISVVDERYGTDPTVNNFCQLSDTSFFDAVIQKGCGIVSTQVREKQTMAEVTQDFKRALKRWRSLHPEGVVIATLGVGPDGHTSGIMPYPEKKKFFEDLFCHDEDDDHFVVGYDAGDKNQYSLRITTTIPFLKQEIDHALVFVSGKNKKEALQNTLDSKEELHVVPARVFHHMKDVVLYTDIDL